VLQLDNAGWHGPENLVAERLMTLGVDPERAWASAGVAPETRKTRSAIVGTHSP
jgi:hypothetical protein